MQTLLTALHAHGYYRGLYNCSSTKKNKMSVTNKYKSACKDTTTIYLLINYQQVAINNNNYLLKGSEKNFKILFLTKWWGGQSKLRYHSKGLTVNWTMTAT